jgi:hypothetical protein
MLAQKAVIKARRFMSNPKPQRRYRYAETSTLEATAVQTQCGGNDVVEQIDFLIVR